MPASDSELSPMKNPPSVEDMEGSLTDVPSPGPPIVPCSTSPSPTTMRPSLSSETKIEDKAISMASNDCTLSLSSPAEASPAKPAVTSPTTLEGIVETVPPATSQIASASDSLKHTGSSHVNISESSPVICVLPSTFGSPDVETDIPNVLTFKGVSVTLENNSVWKQFNSRGTEMILTKQGRRMFPYCRYRLAGLDPDRMYSLVLSIVPSDQHKYRWNPSKWEVIGPADHQPQGLIRAFCHHYSPCRGFDWMNGLVSFYKLKLTNNTQASDGHILLHSMHRYIPRLHLLPVPDGIAPTSGQPVVMGPESMTFTFPQTEFMAVTTYQNFRITQLKINHNPFAKGFREDGNNSRLNRVATGTPTVKRDTQPPVLKAAETTESKNEIMNLSTEEPNAPAPFLIEKKTRLVLKPIMFTPSMKDEPYARYGRRQSLGELVVVQKCAKESTEGTPNAQKRTNLNPEVTSLTPLSSACTPGSSSSRGYHPGYRKRRKKISRRWANTRGREWKATAASPAVVHSPSLTVAMQPELDDVEGLLFVSFTSKEALEIHVRDKPASTSSSVTPVSPVSPVQFEKTENVTPETNREQIARLEAILLQDLKVLRHRQVIHPVLVEVGLKLSSLDPTKSIDLNYLGVHLPIPILKEEQSNDGMAICSGNEGLPFMSRTGKTSDITKIKGWRNKFIRSKDTSPSNCDGSQKNLSAFCSNMLDEYLESEAQQISERAAAFSTNPEGSVAYQLPAKSSSYVKTLDSVLKHRNAASRVPVAANRPCPLSYKPLLYSALRSPAPPLVRPTTPVRAGSHSTRQPTPSHSPPGPGSVVGTDTSSVSQRLSDPGINQKPAVNYGPGLGLPQRTLSHSKVQLKLLEMEFGALNDGLDKTKLTPDRVSFALSTMLTKATLPGQIPKVLRFPKHKAEKPACDQEFCRLGCVCSSLHLPSRGPLHCRRPECMFGCACFKRKITKRLTVQESRQQTHPLYSMTNMECEVQPRPGSHSSKLCNSNVLGVDPEPIFTPRNGPRSLCPQPVQRCSNALLQQIQQQIQDGDKDPVYRYFESKMTCARVREFNSKPPSELNMKPFIPDPKNTTDELQENFHKSVLTFEKAAHNKKQVRKQIEIQSVCQWDKDRKTVIEELYRRLNRNQLSQRFCIGAYQIHPVTKIFMRKPSGSVITYRIRISKRKNDEDEFDGSDEDEVADKSFPSDMDAEEEDGQSDEIKMQVGVTPFHSGVLPAGKLTARTKPAGYHVSGLIQVNGKSYNQARLLLGSMGSLHPANRFAAYITGRLGAPCGMSCRFTPKPDSAQNPPGDVRIKTAGTVVPPIITARKTTDLKTPTPPPGQSAIEESVTSPEKSQNSSTFINTVQTFASSQRSLVSSLQSSSTSSPVCLTVSPTLKTPSFLGQSGTYSFRICPPANQNMRGQNLPGVTLPGGFTLIQLPKPGADGTLPQQSAAGNTTNMDSSGKARPRNDSLSAFDHSAAGPDKNWPDSGVFNGAKDTSSSGSVEPGAAPTLVCDEKMPPEEHDGANNRLVARKAVCYSNMYSTSEDPSSDFSDYFGEPVQCDDLVDIETVEEEQQQLAIAKMKEAACKPLKDSGFRGSCSEVGSAGEFYIQDVRYIPIDQKKRTNHSVLERQRRCEQRVRFDKLHTVLKSDPRMPKLTLLILALKEIQTLTETSKRLEETKARLTEAQSAYMKRLSHLSGKSEQLIQLKLKEICERQKKREKSTKFKPFFSQLLQSRAAALQAKAPPPKTEPRRPLLQPKFNTPSMANLHMILTQNDVKPTPSELQSIPPQPSTPSSRSPPPAVSPPSQPEVAASPLAAEKQSDEPLPSAEIKLESEQKAISEPAQVTKPATRVKRPSQPPLLPAAPQAPPAQEAAPPAPSTPISQTNHAPFALPLIRSKTGRLILPSSLKPLGNGFYTLTVMENKQKKEDGDSNTPDGNSAETKHPSDTESSFTLEENAATPLSKKSVLVPSVALQPLESLEGCTVVGFNHQRATACLSFTPVNQDPPPAEPEPDPSPSAPRRPRGRPRKKKRTRVRVKDKSPAVDDDAQNTSGSETSVPAEDASQNGVEAPGRSGSKRRRGRPAKNRKKKSACVWNPPVVRAEKSPSNSDVDSPVRSPRILKSLEAKPGESPATEPSPGQKRTSRHLTRGALGKDFPSAKKRSWIDIEKELEDLK